MHRLLLALGESDCEAVGSGFLAQPVNAISSLAFTVAGLVLIPFVRRASGLEAHLRAAFVAAMAATGIGSFMYHGPQGTGSQFLHDSTFLAALGVIAVANLGSALHWDSRLTWLALGGFLVVAVGALIAAPTATNLLAGLAAVLVVAGDLLLRRRRKPDARWAWAAVAAMALALAFFMLGRTDGPLCDSDSLLQGHALWHVFAAVALAAYFVSTGSAREGIRS